MILGMSFLYNVIIGAGKGTAIYWLFPFPLVFMFFLGKKEGGMASAVFFCALCILLINPISFEIYEYSTGESLRFLAALLLVILIAYGLESSRNKYELLLIEKHKNLLDEKGNLEKALREIKTLSGLIPICSNCKKIRNDKGYWQKVEVYVRDHSFAEFTHGFARIVTKAFTRIMRFQKKNSQEKPPGKSFQRTLFRPLNLSNCKKIGIGLKNHRQAAMRTTYLLFSAWREEA